MRNAAANINKRKLYKLLIERRNEAIMAKKIKKNNAQCGINRASSDVSLVFAEKRNTNIIFSASSAVASQCL